MLIGPEEEESRLLVRPEPLAHPINHLTCDDLACGPESFLYDIRNAVAEAQLILADGYGTCTDLFLHTETYRYVIIFVKVL